MEIIVACTVKYVGAFILRRRESLNNVFSHTMKLNNNAKSKKNPNYDGRQQEQKLQGN